jgi:hypothetical protein
MPNVIQQSVVLPAAAPTLFEMYLSPAAHADITGAPVTIGDAPGAEFRAFNDMLTGTILAIVRPRLVVQSWRSPAFRPQDSDSTLILIFTPEGDGAAGRIDLVHLDVPDHDLKGVREGWESHYWTPWRKYLETRVQSAPSHQATEGKS